MKVFILYMDKVQETFADIKGVIRSEAGQTTQ
jgi:hypothetical protein